MILIVIRQGFTWQHGLSSGLDKSQQADDDIEVDTIFSTCSDGPVVVLRKTEKLILHSIHMNDTAGWVIYHGV